LDRQADGIEGKPRGVLAEDGDGVRYVADDFALIDIELKRDFGVLEVVIASASVRFVGAHRE
jgi:hypothetical protein